MSYKETMVFKETPVYTLHCDGPTCQKELVAGCPYTLRGGYGSTILDDGIDDGADRDNARTKHFCSLDCLRFWLTTPELINVHA